MMLGYSWDLGFLKKPTFHVEGRHRVLIFFYVKLLSLFIKNVKYHKCLAMLVLTGNSMQLRNLFWSMHVSCELEKW